MRAGAEPEMPNRPHNANEWNRLLKAEGLGVIQAGDQMKRGRLKKKPRRRKPNRAS